MLRFTKVIAGILLLLAVALAGYAWMLSRKPVAPPVAAAPPVKAPRSETTTYSVVVAAQSLPAGQPIDARALRIAQLPINPAGAFHDVRAVAGRVPVTSLGQGSPLMESQLVSGLASRLNPGERAVAVKADEVMGVGGNVRPGDQVDVFFSIKVDGKDVDRSQSRLLLARKRVLAFGAASVDAQPEDDDGKSSRSNQRDTRARTVVLAVGVEEVNRLALGEAAGRLWLALRHPGDTAEPDPALFAPLPTVLQPRTDQAGRDASKALSAMDMAQAGLATADLAAGHAVVKATRTATAPGRAQRSPRSASTAPAGHEVELIRGDRRDTVRY